MILSKAKKAIYRTMMFGSLVSFLITTGSCQITQNLAKKEPQNKAISDSLFLAQKHNQFLEVQEQNRDMPQGEIDH